MGSKRLNDVVLEIIDLLKAGQSINVRQCVVDKWDEIDDDGVYLSSVDGVCAKVSSRARSLLSAAAKKRSEAQPDLPFRLPVAVAMDIEGIELKPTRNLNQAEFDRAIEIREKQIDDDKARLSEWRAARTAARKFWRQHPDWTFGQCLDAILGADA